MISTAEDARKLEIGFTHVVHEAPITRTEIAWYMVASYDLNPIHVDEPFAKEAGFNTVIAQGMLPLGYLARELVAKVGMSRIRSLRGDFVRLIFPGEQLTTELRLLNKTEREDGIELEWSLAANGTDGTQRIRGHAKSWHPHTNAQTGGDL